jgi:hypothetical protein
MKIDIQADRPARDERASRPIRRSRHRQEEPPISAAAALSNLRVVRSTILGVRECLRDALSVAQKAGIAARGARAEVGSDLVECLVDAMSFVERGEGKLQSATSRIAQALVAVGVDVRFDRGGGSQRRSAGRKRRGATGAILAPAVDR